MVVVEIEKVGFIGSKVIFIGTKSKQNLFELSQNGIYYWIEVIFIGIEPKLLLLLKLNQIWDLLELSQKMGFINLIKIVVVEIEPSRIYWN